MKSINGKTASNNLNQIVCWKYGFTLIVYTDSLLHTPSLLLAFTCNLCVPASKFINDKTLSLVYRQVESYPSNQKPNMFFFDWLKFIAANSITTLLSPGRIVILLLLSKFLSWPLILNCDTKTTGGFLLNAMLPVFMLLIAPLKPRNNSPWSLM